MILATLDRIESTHLHVHSKEKLRLSKPYWGSGTVPGLKNAMAKKTGEGGMRDTRCGGGFALPWLGRQLIFAG